MARGLPDYYRGVDIAYQALSELIVRPKYGGAIGTFGTKQVTASDNTSLVSVSGKGMTYGAYVHLDHDQTQKDSKIQLYIDGNQLVRKSWQTLYDYNIGYARAFPVVLNWFDDVGFIYSASVSYGLTFETGVEIIYEEAHARTPIVAYSLIYALI